MKRFLIFIVFYSPLLLLGVLALVKEARTPFDLNFMFWMLGISYALGLVPSLIAALVDWSLADKPVYLRVPAVTLTAIFAVSIALAVFNFGEMLHVWTSVIIIASVSGIPAAICSWLSAKFAV